MTQDANQAVTPEQPLNPFTEPIPFPGTLTYEAKREAEVERIGKLLAIPVPQNATKQREQGGKRFHYVDTPYIIRKLNAIFGWDGWNNHLDPASIQIVKLGEGKAIVYAVQTIEVHGASHDGLGACIAYRDTPDAYDTAVKGAASDALKRAAINLGEALGLSLYGDGDLADDSGPTPPAQAPRRAPKPAPRRPVEDDEEDDEPPTDEGDGEVRCANYAKCHGVVEAFGKYSVQDLVKSRKQRYGAVLCSSCAAEAAKKLRAQG